MTTWLDGKAQTVPADDPRLAEIEAERVRLCQAVIYDPETGVFRWATDRANGRVKAGSVAGSLNAEGYRYISFEGRLYKANRLAWLISHGESPECDVDHINGNKSDDRLCNLRVVSKSGNRQNIASAYASNKSGLLGVSLDGRRWRAIIHVHGKQKYLGSFETKEQAHAAYVAAKKELHPFSARLG